MENFENLLIEFNGLNGAKFVGIKGYTNKQGEISNYVINGNISVYNAKKSDYETLKNACPVTISEQIGHNVELTKKVLADMVDRAEKNLSENIEERTNQSQGQSNAYRTLTNGVQLHIDSKNVHIFGKYISKVTIKKGEPKPEVKSKEPTIIKNKITKLLELKTDGFVRFILKNVKGVNISGNTLEFTPAE